MRGWRGEEGARADRLDAGAAGLDGGAGAKPSGASGPSGGAGGPHGDAGGPSGGAGGPHGDAGAQPKFSKGSARMFESNFLEWFSHVHPATPAVLFVPVILLCLYLGLVRHGLPLLPSAGWFVGGYALWTLMEYWLHRLFFHLPVRGPRSERVYFFVHGVHHDWPWDTSRLVMPPSVSITLGVIFYFLFRALLGPVELYPIFAGFVSGYVLYDTAHWYVHARAPRTRLGKWLRREHLVHHFKESGSRFGVSCPWWDHVFRTTGKGRAAAARGRNEPRAA